MGFGYWCALGALALFIPTTLGCGAGAAAGGAAVSPALQSARQSQAKGAHEFAEHCANCHGDNGEGDSRTPALIGDGTLPKTHEDRAPFHTAADLFQYVKTQMPLPKRRIGSLPDDEYWAIVSFLLKARGLDIPAAGLGEDSAPNVVVNP